MFRPLLCMRTVFVTKKRNFSKKLQKGYKIVAIAAEMCYNKYSGKCCFQAERIRVDINHIQGVEKMAFTEEKSENKEKVSETVKTNDKPSEPAEADTEAACAQKKKLDIFAMLSDLGEYFTSVAIRIAKAIGYGFMYTIATVYRWLDLLKEPFKRFVRELTEFISSPFKRYRKARRLGASEIAKARKEKGAWGGFTAWLKVAGHTMFGKRGIMVTLVNWGLPVVCCVFLFNVVSYANSQNYALRLTVNGDFVGYISTEQSFTDAENIVQGRINYTGSTTEVISFEAVYEVENIGNGTVLNRYQIADKMLMLLGKEVKEGYGLYLGGSYYGTLISHDALDREMAKLLGKYTEGGDKETAKFDKEISYIHGTYLADSFVDENDIIRQFTSIKKNATYYSITEDDTLSSVLTNSGLTISELNNLNPEFDTTSDIVAGNRVKTSSEEPFLTVMVTREEHYTETFDFETEYVDDSTIYVLNKRRRVKGELGERYVVANVSYINGNEINRRVLSTQVTKEPVTEVIAVGTKPRRNDTAPGAELDVGQMLWPVGGFDGGTLSEPVWWMGGYSGHKGVDISTAIGTPIYAAENGVVVSSVWAGNGDDRGNYVIIQGDSGYTTYYYHNSELLVSAGERVTAGDMIAFSGSTGRSYGPHCHFGVSVGGTYLNPTDYLPSHKMTASYAARVAAYS